MAVVLFGINIFGLHLPAFIADLPLIAPLPSLQTLVFMLLFIGYLVIVWSFAHHYYQRHVFPDISRRAYIQSNILFAVPVLLPWLAFSGVADIINLLPFDSPKQLLVTPAGQIIYYAAFLFIVAIVGPALIQKAWGCQPMGAGPDRMRIEALCRRAGMGYAEIVYWPIFGGRMITAGVMGLIKKFRYILVTEALLDLLTPSEIETVIAHEIGHIKKKHLLFYLFFFAGYLLFSVSVYQILDYLTFYAVIHTNPSPTFFFTLLNSASTFNSIRYLLLLILTLLIYFRFIFGYFMRNFERQADTYVFSLFDSAWPLISTFAKIARTSGQPADKPNWHHYSISERIDYLQKCEADKTWIRRHDRKIIKSLAVYLLGMLSIVAVSYHLNFGDPSRKLNVRILEKLYVSDLIDYSDDPKLFIGLGDFYYDRQKPAKAIRAYEHALALAPTSAHAMNNLAWLYATSADPDFRDPRAALDLALDAVAIQRAPHILDTLAESLFVNGRIEEALAIANEALLSAKDNRAYYEGQVRRFEKALSE